MYIFTLPLCLHPCSPWQIYTEAVISSQGSEGVMVLPEPVTPQQGHGDEPEVTTNSSVYVSDLETTSVSLLLVPLSLLWFLFHHLLSSLVEVTLQQDS